MANEAQRHPSVTSKMRFFEFGHLQSETLRDLSSLFAELAHELMNRLPDDPELVIALDKLRESKDRAVALAAQDHE